MKTISKLLSILLVVVFFSSCEDDNDTITLETNTIVDVAVDNNLTSLVAAVTRADLVSTLSSNGSFTVFAPTNDAFQDLLDSDQNWNSLADVPIATLDAVLKYHVVNGANVQGNQLSNGDVFVLGGSITIDLSTGVQIKTTSNQTVNIIVSSATNDVQGTNGVVHAIDTVLLP